MSITFKIVQLVSDRSISGVNNVAKVYDSLSSGGTLYCFDESRSILNVVQTFFLLRRMKREGYYVHSHGFFMDVINYCSGRTYMITTVHNELYNDFRFEYGRLLGKVFELIQLSILRRVISFSCSISVKVYLEAKGISTGVVQNGLLFDIKSYVLGTGDRKIYFSGPLIPRKNLSLILEKYVNSNLEMPLQVYTRSDWKSYAREYGSCKIVFGSYTSLLTAYTQDSFYISFSLFEGLPMSVIEAVCFGLVPVLSDIKPHREIIDSLKLDDLRTFASIEEAFDWMLSLNQVEVRELSTKIAARARLVYGYDKFRSRISDAYYNVGIGK